MNLFERKKRQKTLNIGRVTHKEPSLDFYKIRMLLKAHLRSHITLTKPRFLKNVFKKLRNPRKTSISLKSLQK
jgi:hypothetical protein